MEKLRHRNSQVTCQRLPRWEKDSSTPGSQTCACATRPQTSELPPGQWPALPLWFWGILFYLLMSDGLRPHPAGTYSLE